MEPKDKKEYEIAYLARTEEDAAGIVAQVRAEGETREERSAGRIKLSYEIEGEAEALFGVLKAMLEPAAAKRLEDAFRMDKRVMRSLIMIVDIKGKRKGGDAPRIEPASPRPARPVEPQSMPLSNEALEKKIEEILQ
jgi:ribosomal protein S6